MRCSLSPAYFIDQYCWIEDQELRKWVPFELWPAQAETLEMIWGNPLVIILKAMKLGLTWLCIAYAMWEMLFRPGGLTLLFSLKDSEAVDLLKRLKDMHGYLPHFLQASVETDNDHEWKLARLESRARAFPCTESAGRNFTGSLAIIDEADFIPILDKLIGAVQPGVEAGGKLIVNSASNKEAPGSEFKKRYQDAVAGRNNYVAVFLPWNARPDRDEVWYERQCRDYPKDVIWANYPETAMQALAPRSTDKRFDPEWLMEWERMNPIKHPLGVPGLVVFELPEEGETYVVPADPAEGNPGSNPSAAAVLNSRWEQVAVLAGRIEPDVFGGYLVEIARWYNDAVIVPERNNHGHTVILAIRQLGAEELLYVNPFDSTPGREKYGWLSSPRFKSMAMDVLAQTLRESNGRLLRDEVTVQEVGAIEAATLKAPSGMYDDRAMTLMIGYAALRWPSLRQAMAVDAYIRAPDPMVTVDRGGFT